MSGNGLTQIAECQGDNFLCNTTLSNKFNIIMCIFNGKPLIAILN